LKEAILDGTLDVLASDHAPHGILEKECEFSEASCGAIGLETIVALAVELSRELGLSPSRLSELLSINPAKLLNIPYGLAKGSPADITLIDPCLKWRYIAKEGFSKSHNSPFDGRMFTGRAVCTIVGGEIVWEAQAGEA
jgi:dihydroorotase